MEATTTRNKDVGGAVVATRNALTLVELLVVIVLVTTLVTTAIPIMSPGGDARKIREASRAVNSFFAGARARAIETGRPYGVAIRRQSSDTGSADDNGVGVELAYVETPPAYAGLDGQSVARIGQLVVNNVNQLGLQLLRYETTEDDSLPTGLDRDLIPAWFFRPGDILEFNGGLFRIDEGVDASVNWVTLATSVAADSSDGGVSGYFPGYDGTTDMASLGLYGGGPAFTIVPIGGEELRDLAFRFDRDGYELPPPEQLATMDSESLGAQSPYWTAPGPYKIYRRAVAAPGQPLQLPAGMAIDLQASGFSDGTLLHRNGDRGGAPTVAPGDGEVFNDDVVVMFSPEGAVESATFRARDLGAASGIPQPATTNVTSSLALLIGRRELIPAERDSNWVGATDDDPINLSAYANSLEDEETLETLAKYNWLNLDSRWIVIGAQTGSVTTIENSAIRPADIADRTPFGLLSQLEAARAAAPSRLKAGGR